MHIVARFGLRPVLGEHAWSALHVAVVDPIALTETTSDLQGPSLAVAAELSPNLGSEAPLGLFDPTQNVPDVLGNTISQTDQNVPHIRHAKIADGLHSIVRSEPLKFAISDFNDGVTTLAPSGAFGAGLSLRVPDQSLSENVNASLANSATAAQVNLEANVIGSFPSVSGLLASVDDPLPGTSAPIADATTDVLLPSAVSTVLDSVTTQNHEPDTFTSIAPDALPPGASTGVHDDAASLGSSPTADLSLDASATPGDATTSPMPASDTVPAGLVPSTVDTPVGSVSMSTGDAPAGANDAGLQGVGVALAEQNGSTEVNQPAAAAQTAVATTNGFETVLVAPSVPQPSGPGDIVGILLQNNTSASEAAGVITFSEVFAKGAVSPDASLVAKIGNQISAVQMDVKSTNDDGSVRQAIITMQAPSLAAHSSASVMLAVGNSTTTPAISAQQLLSSGYDLNVTVAIHNADGTTTTKAVDSASVLQQAVSHGTAQTWLQGPLAGEYIATAQLAPNLSVTFDVRQDTNGEHHTDVTFSRDVAYTTDVSTLNYDVTVTQSGQTLFSQANISQYAFSTWNAEFNSNGVVAPHVVYDMQYLINTGAIPSYDLNSGVLSSVVSNESQLLAASDTGPMGTGTITKYMPQTGGRPDIGITPTWTADYIVSQDQSAQAVVTANANAAGSVPWHLIDAATGQPVSLLDHPHLWIDPRGQYAWDAPDNLPVAFDPSGPFALDTAHQPALSYVPYLLSGSASDLANLKAQASYIIAANGIRGASNDLFTDSSQVRGTAWDLRDVADAAYALPDADPMKAYFTKVVNDNLQNIIDTYVNGSAGAAEGQAYGWVKGAYGGGNMAPWQQDFLAITMEHLAEQGFTQAHTILQWQDNFISGRFLASAQGFSAPEGIAYNLTVGDPATGETYSTWQQIFSASVALAPENTIAQSYIDSGTAGGYAANARAGLASVISGTELVHAIQAYAWLVSKTPEVTASFDTNPTWDIVPRLADGSYLTSDKIQISTSLTGSVLTAGDFGSLLVGGAGNDSLIGGAGIDILMGGNGHQLLQGNGGNDYIFVGAGPETVAGGDGSDTIVMGPALSAPVTVDGGSGFDTVVLAGDYSDYAISIDPSTQNYVLTADTGTLTAKNVEAFQFADGTISSDSLMSGVTNSTTVIDTASDHPWQSETTTVDAKGSLKSQSIVNDNGTHWVNSFDTTGTQAWLWKSVGYDDNGAERTEVQANHDGTYSLTIYDAANQYAWSSAKYVFDSGWNETGATTINDDGSTSHAPLAGSVMDVTSWYTTPYDANANAAPADMVLTGGANTDILFGFAGNDTINGGAGNDCIAGGRGNDLLTGGDDHDTFIFRNGDGNDVIADFAPGTDTISLGGYGVRDFASLQADMSQVGADTLLTFDDSNHVLLQHVAMAQLSSSDFLFS